MIPPNQRQADCMETLENIEEISHRIHWSAFALKQSHLTRSNEILRITSLLGNRFPQMEQRPPQLRLSSSTEASSMTDYDGHSPNDSPPPSSFTEATSATNGSKSAAAQPMQTDNNDDSDSDCIIEDDDLIN